MKNYAEFGWGAPPFKEQFPSLSDHDAAHFDKDNGAMIRLSIRGYLTDSQKTAAMRKITKAVERALRAKAGSDQ